MTICFDADDGLATTLTYNMLNSKAKREYKSMKGKEKDLVPQSIPISSN